MLHPNILVGASSISGRGLFASGILLPGDVTWQWSDGLRVVSTRQLQEWSLEERQAFLCHAYQCDDDLWCGGDPATEPALLMNHSCNPNTWFVSDQAMVARRRIEAGEEVTYDYATSESTAWSLVCRCQAPECRGTISGLDYLKAEVCNRYAGHFLSYLARRVRAWPT